MREVKQAGPNSPSQVDPFAALPVSIGEPLLKLWTMNQDLYPAKLPLVALVASFRSEDDVTDTELAATIQAMTRPEAIKGFRFAADLKCHLASEVSEIRRRNREKRNMAEIRRTGEQPAEFESCISVSELLKRRKAS